MTVRARVFIAGVILVAGAACGGEPMGNRPTPGNLTVVLASPGSSDGAVLLLVTGGPVESVSPAGSYQVASAAVGTSTRRVVVTGDIGAGDLIKLRVPDVNSTSYLVQVEQVADRNSFALLDATAYTATVRR